MKTTRIFLGVAIWCALAAVLIWCGSSWQVEDHNVLQRLAPVVWNYSTRPRTEQRIRFEQPTEASIGDPIFLIEGFDCVRQIGEISDLPSGGDASGESGGESWTREGRILLYPSAPPLSQDAFLTYHTTPDSMQWVLETMLPPEKRREAAEELRDAFMQHRQEVLDALRPVMEKSWRDSYAVIEEDLPAVIRRHRPALQALGVRYQTEIVQQQIVPLVKQEIWPIVRKHAEPVMTEVGREMWDRASLWRFGWRYVYDRSFDPRDSLVQEEWRRFLREDAIPVLEDHTGDFVAVQQRVLRDTARNEAIQRVVRENMAQLANDPQLRAVVWSIVREAIVENPRLKEVLERNWRSPEAQQAFQLAARRFEPTVVRVGQLLFGDEQSGISPEFARVLRHEILHKDRRWLVLESGSGGLPAPEVLVVHSSDRPTPNPFVYITYNHHGS